jgi:hypothetical protein
MMKRPASITASLILLLDLGACVLPDKQIGDGDDEASTSGPLEETDADGATESGSDEGIDEGSDEGMFDECAPPFAGPAEDLDCDGVAIPCDNASTHPNPEQLNHDGDMFGDVVDLCPLLASGSNTADSDRDGIGNACDLCPKLADQYVVGPEVAVRLWVRNIPSHADFDQDGIGDACDNCVAVPNCQDYGPDNPAPLGAEAGNGANCQLDDDLDGIGDACEGVLMPAPTSAGLIGLTTADDFDQDGLINLEDVCPRQPVEPRSCISDDGCDPGAQCADTPALDDQRYCNHVDSDADNVGDVCDTCPTAANPLQVTDGGMQFDDEDGDFIGGDCETHVECSVEQDPRPIAFYDVAVAGMCCVTSYPGDDVLHDPDGTPIRLDCTSEQEDAEICRKVPASVVAQPGMIELPLGCTAALAEAGVAEATRLNIYDFDGDAAALWATTCMLPPHDQDFDGLGDACDLCPFAYDPLDEPYVDGGTGELWPDFGRFCNGDYALVPGAACYWP